MAQTFNGATAALTNAAADVIYKFNIRDFSEAGNDRAAIDVTTAASTRRQVVYGFAEVTEFTFECVYDIDVNQVGTSPAITRAVLEALLLENSGKLNISFVNNSESTPETDTFGGERNAVVKGFTFSGEVDGVIVYSITFGILH
tara:strand:+ start:1001 stop:1432 length:432 start_codon:yes stop_codon:yes gene_type:complete